MLGRYQMKRGASLADLPEGVRQDTRKHTSHVLRPEREPVAQYLGGSLDWEGFAARYRDVVERRFQEDRAAFDRIAALAREGDVHLGCSCPTKKNPDVRRCHTWLALELLREKYPELDVRFPAPQRIVEAT